MNAQTSQHGAALMLAILDAARLLEPDPAAAQEWFNQIPIQSLGQETAASLVWQGRGDAVLEFLWTAIESEPAVHW